MTDTDTARHELAKLSDFIDSLGERTDDRSAVDIAISMIGSASFAGLEDFARALSVLEKIAGAPDVMPADEVAGFSSTMARVALNGFAQRGAARRNTPRPVPPLPVVKDAAIDDVEKHSSMMLEIRGALHVAGIHGDVRWIRNQYWPDHKDYDDVRVPWAVCTTELGHIIVGPRKRVIAINWKYSVIDVASSDVVAADWITHGDGLCHAWGMVQASQCLTRLWTQAKVPPS